MKFTMRDVQFRWTGGIMMSQRHYWQDNGQACKDTKDYLPPAGVLTTDQPWVEPPGALSNTSMAAASPAAPTSHKAGTAVLKCIANGNQEEANQQRDVVKRGDYHDRYI